MTDNVVVDIALEDKTLIDKIDALRYLLTSNYPNPDCNGKDRAILISKYYYSLMHHLI